MKWHDYERDFITQQYGAKPHRIAKTSRKLPLYTNGKEYICAVCVRKYMTASTEQSGSEEMLDFGHYGKWEVMLFLLSNIKYWIDEFHFDGFRFDGVTTAKGHFTVEGAKDQEIAWAGIGQYLDAVNPCRYLTFMGVIAGGGEAAEPYIVASAGAGLFGGHHAKKTSTGRIMEQETAEAITELMRSNVGNGYGDDNFHGLTVCAKSGTSELGGDKRPNAMFAGFVADENYPLAFIVVVEEGGFGAQTCIPIISQILKACMNEMRW